MLTLPSLSKARLLAGKEGLERGIRWVYKPEDMNFSKWVKGRELMIISTPVIQSKDFDLLKLVKKAIRNNLSGAILLVGEKYIESIKREVLLCADQNHFPLFVMSGDIPLIDIFEEIGHTIAYYDTHETDYEEALSNIIFGNEINVEALKIKCEMMGYKLVVPQVLFVIHIDSREGIEAYDRQFIGEKIKGLFKCKNIALLLSNYSNNYVGLIRSTSESKEVMQEIYSDLTLFLKEQYPKIQCIMGIGKKCEHLEKIQDSFKQASKCITIAQQMGNQEGFYEYSRLGVLNLLYEMDNVELINEFIKYTIGPLLTYDKENNTELVTTLKAYIENNRSLIHTAETIHTHKNTVKYRIGRIEEILGRDMENAMDRLELINAILCYKLGK